MGSLPRLMCTDFLTYLLLPALNNIIILWTNMRGFLTYLLFSRPNNIIIWWAYFLSDVHGFSYLFIAAGTK